MASVHPPGGHPPHWPCSCLADLPLLPVDSFSKAPGRVRGPALPDLHLHWPTQYLPEPPG